MTFSGIENLNERHTVESLLRHVMDILLKLTSTVELERYTIEITTDCRPLIDNVQRYFVRESSVSKEFADTMEKVSLLVPIQIPPHRWRYLKPNSGVLGQNQAWVMAQSMPLATVTS